MEWNDEKTLELIHFYQSNELLWNATHSGYKNRTKRYDALQEIANHFKTTVFEIERKIKNLTSQFYREKRRVTDSKKSNSDSVYQSKWFGYKSLSFLINKNNPTATIDKTIDTDTPDESNDAQPLPNDGSHTSADELIIKRPWRNPNKELVSQALTIMQSVVQRQIQPHEKDEDTLFGEYIAAKLKKMDKSTNAIVRHRINNIIFETEIGCPPHTYEDYARSSSHSRSQYSTGSPNYDLNANPPTVKYE